ncbi:transmembrane protein 53 [Pholidichthys leucotaenia]
MLARKSMRRAKAYKITKNVTFYINELRPVVPGSLTQGSQDHNPMMVMLPWLGSHPKAVAKYCEIYFHIGFDVLVMESKIKDFLWPRWGLERDKCLLELLESEPFVSRPLLVHAFSIGRYSFGQMLVHISMNTQKYESPTKRIEGQIYDSLVAGSMTHMATGLGKTVLPRSESLVRRVSLLYFKMFKEQITEHLEKAIDVFWNIPATTPALLFYCNNDPLCDAKTVEQLAAYWRSRGMKVTEKRWEESIHAGHLKRHPEEYLSTLHTFLNSLHMTSHKAKL